MNRIELSYSNYILTNIRTIIQFCRDISLSVCTNTARLLVTGLREPDDYLRLYSVCVNLYYLSRLAYKDNNYENKLFSNEYETYVFKTYLESEDDYSLMIRLQRTEDPTIEIMYDDIRPYYNKLILLEGLWCEFIAMEEGQAFPEEYAYAFEYVLTHDDMEYPSYNPLITEKEKHPINLPNFDYKGVVIDYFERIMGGSF